ncbi:biotin/lipoyl-containing protein, partial [Rhizobium ruizarguesonis]
VREDMVIAAVMTDKATVEIPSPVNVTVTWLAGEVGDRIAVKAPLVRIETAGNVGEVQSVGISQTPITETPNAEIAKPAPAAPTPAAPQALVSPQ